MGVHGLWRLLDSFGTVIKPDDLKGKRVAIDASIWIVQFRASAAPGEDVEHKILEGFLARILKLLFYGIKPVFVFDGMASSNKGAEHLRRMQQRSRNAEALLKRRAKQILMAQVAAGALDLEALKAAMANTADATSGAADEGSTTRTAADLTAKLREEEEDEEGGGAAPAGRSAEHPDAMDVSGVASAIDKALVANAVAPRGSGHHGKRRRRGEERARHGHGSGRRRRLAPDAVSARSTMHFLKDVEELIEELARQEARVLHNVLHSTSTSLFMGPRRALDGDGDTDAHAPHNTSSIPTVSGGGPPVVVVEAADEAISVTDSDGDAVKSVRVDDAMTSSSSSFSDCRAVSSREVSVAESDVVVQDVDAQRRPVSSPAPAVLQSSDLARYLTTLSQLTPPALTADAAAATENRQEALEVVDGEAVTAAAAAEQRAIPPRVDADASPTVASSTADASIQIHDSSSDVSACSSALDDDEEEEEEEEGDGTDDDDDEEDDEEEEEEGQTSDSDSWEGLLDPAAADMTWEPFTQRLDPALLLQHLSSTRAASPPALHTPPSAAATHRTPAEHESAEDDDYTPVKLGSSAELPRRTARPAAAAVVLVVQSSEEDEASNHAVPPRTAAPTPAATHSEAAPRAEKAVSGPSQAFVDHCGGTAAPRTACVNRRVATVPFELLHVVELLDCCGIPYVLSPAEADAQCAFLARHGLVDAVFTEDSDVLVHGATTVLRGFFSQSKSVVAYRQAELAACGITKVVLVALASLLGCDYTAGVTGIGLVGALQALVVAWTAAGKRDSPAAVLHVLRRWSALVQCPPQFWQDVDEEMTIAQFALLEAVAPQWRLLERRPTFPEAAAVEAFYDAAVDDDVTPFVWMPPDWQRMRIFAGALGALSATWLVQRFELARKECAKREAEAARAEAGGEAQQRRLTDFGAREQIRAEWAFKKQPARHSAVLSQLRAVQALPS